MDKVLVTGATGNIGTHVVAALQQQGVQVRAFVRNAAKAETMLGNDVELVVGDFGNAASVEHAVAGVEGVFLACANHPRQVEYEIGVIETAREAGVQRIVKLSALGAEVGSPVAFWDWHARIEERLRASAIPAVVLQPAFSTTNLLGSAEQIKGIGMLFAPADGARVAMIDPRDVAAVAAATLTQHGHDGHTYVLTGPEAITFEHVAEALSAATGRTIPFVAVPDDAAQQALIESGMPEFVAGQIVAVFGLLRRGLQNRTTDVVHTITRREPRSFARFAHDYAPLFT